MIHKSSYSISNSYLKINTSKTVSNQAINQRRKNMNIELLDNLNDNLLSKIYVPHKNTKLYKGRMIAVDGSDVNLSKDLHKYGFNLSLNLKSALCTTSLIKFPLIIIYLNRSMNDKY